MGEMTIRLDDSLLGEVRDMAERQGIDPSDLAREALAFSVRAFPRTGLDDAPRQLSDAERRRRDGLLGELRDIRAMTLKPLAFDSTLMIREMRDTDG